MQSKTYKIICFDFSANDNSDGALNKFDTDISVHFNGKNKWLAPVIFKSTCKINVAFFPFDEQVLIGPLQDPVTWYGIKLHRDANDPVGLSKQRKVGLAW